MENQTLKASTACYTEKYYADLKEKFQYSSIWLSVTSVNIS